MLALVAHYEWRADAWTMKSISRYHGTSGLVATYIQKTKTI